MESGIILTNEITGAQIWVTSSYKKRKSYDLLFKSKNEETWIKIGTIKNLSKFKEIFENNNYK